MSTTMIVPAYIIDKHLKEALEKIRRDLVNMNPQNITQDGLISNRAAAWSLEYINSRSADEENWNDTLFSLMIRNREREDLEKTAEAVISIFERQNFTVSEALLFMKYLESLVLASPVNF